MERLLVGVSGSAAVFNLLSYLVVLRGIPTREVKMTMAVAADALLPASTVALVCARLRMFATGSFWTARRA